MFYGYGRWISCSSSLLKRSLSSKSIQFYVQFRSQPSSNSFGRRSRQSIRSFDQSKVLPFEVQNSSRRFRLLIRPTFFTLGFVAFSFSSCAIWQYESHRAKLKKTKENWQFKENPKEIRSQLKNVWKDISQSQRVIGTIIGLNFIVFLLWRVKRLEPFLLKYFTSTPFKQNLSSMLLSTFSHHNGIHFLCNMYVLWSFSEPILRLLGKEQFFAVYLSGGVISSWLSYVFKVITRTGNISLGASGSIMTLIGAICTQFPDAKLSIIFLPFFVFSAKSGLIGLMSFDLLGTVMRWRYLDHSAHLGGVLFGIFYIKYGYKLLWESFKPLVEFWHRLREKFE